MRTLSLLLFCIPALAQETTEGLAALPVADGFYKGAPVRFRVWQGQALVEGDILLGSAEALSRKDDSRGAIVIPGDRPRWPNSVIPYELDPALPSQDRITAAIAEWQTKTPIRFKLRENETDYVRFVRASSSGTCNSNVGRIGGRQTINLGDGCSTGNTIHEMGHSIGMWHTQSRIDRSRHLKVRYENIDKNEWSQYDQQLLNGEDVGPYDFGSIMHYSATGFTRTPRNSVDTIPLGIPVGQRAALSTGDILAIRKIYGDVVKETTIDSFPTGQVVIVDGQEVTTPQSFPWAEGETHVVKAVETIPQSTPTTRLHFATWSDGGEIEHTISAAPGSFYMVSYAGQFQLRTSINPANSGTVDVFPPSGDGFYSYGTTLFLRANPTGDFRFLGWTAGVGGVTFLGANSQGGASNPVELTLRNPNPFYVAVFTRSPITRITSEPEGMLITVDNSAGYTPRNFNFNPNTIHSVSIADSQSLNGDTSRGQFKEWSDGGERSHSYVATAGDQTLTVRATVQHQVNLFTSFFRSGNQASPTVTNNMRLNPAPSAGFYDDGTMVEFSVEGPAGLPFANWYGDFGNRKSPQPLNVREQLYLVSNFVSSSLAGLNAIVNDASQQPGALTPGTLFTIYLAGVGPSSDLILPDTKDHQIVVAGKPARILRVSRDFINFQIPYNLPDFPSTTFTLTTPGGTSTRIATVLRALPGIYTVDGTGRGQAMAFFSDGTANSAQNPAKRGDEVRIMVTGVGKLNGQLDDGTITTDNFTPLDPISVEVDGFRAEVTNFAPGDSPGQYYVTFRIPDLARSSPDTRIIVFSSGAESQLNATIAVQ